MPFEAGGMGTNVSDLFKAKAGNLLPDWRWTTKQSPKHGLRFVVRSRY